MDKNTSKILISNHIFTGMKDRPVSGAVVITDHKITAVTTKEEALKLRGKDTIVYELGDQLVCPGFVDNHVFFTGFVWSHLGADLSGAGSRSMQSSCPREGACLGMDSRKRFWKAKRIWTRRCSTLVIRR